MPKCRKKRDVAQIAKNLAQWKHEWEVNIRSVYTIELVAGTKYIGKIGEVLSASAIIDEYDDDANQNPIPADSPFADN